MGLKAALSKTYAYFISRKVDRIRRQAAALQSGVFSSLIQKASLTSFGKEHDFSAIHTYADFKARVPVRDYEELKPWLERVKKGESDVLWPGRPIYLSKTSGTTSGTKYIPISRESMPNHIESARNALLVYI